MHNECGVGGPPIRPVPMSEPLEDRPRSALQPQTLEWLGNRLAQCVRAGCPHITTRRTAATTCCAGIRYYESSPRKRASASSVNSGPTAGTRSVSPKRATPNAGGRLCQSHLLTPRPRPVARAISEPRVPVTLVMLHSARCGRITDRNRGNFEEARHGDDG